MSRLPRRRARARKTNGRAEQWPADRSLRAARQFAGLTQEQLAAAAYCTTATIWDLEHGRNAHPSHEKVVNIVAALRGYDGLRSLKASDLFPVKGPVLHD